MTLPADRAGTQWRTGRGSRQRLASRRLASVACRKFREQNGTDLVGRGRAAAQPSWERRFASFQIGQAT